MNPHIMSGQHTRGNRNFGLEGAGKGDGDRTSDKTAYDENLAQVQFSGVPASQDPSFVKSKRGYKKVFGPREVKDSLPEETPIPATPPPTCDANPCVSVACPVHGAPPGACSGGW